MIVQVRGQWAVVGDEVGRPEHHCGGHTSKMQPHQKIKMIRNNDLALDLDQNKTDFCKVVIYVYITEDLSIS